MGIFEAVFLGAVQGLTEFLPISSSGHLFALPWMFGWKDSGLIFDVSLHMGTLLSIVLYFWRDWLDILKNYKKPLLWLIILGCIPAVVIGYMFEDYFDTVFRAPALVGAAMITMGLLLWAAEAVGRRTRDVSQIGVKDAVFIGVMQALALVPGVSRSGITMTAGLMSGLKRQAAARFSFLLAVPITFGAGMYKLRLIFGGGLEQSDIPRFVAGVVVSSAVGFLAIRFLLRYLQEHTFYIFVWYRLVFGALIFAAIFLRG